MDSFIFSGTFQGSRIFLSIEEDESFGTCVLDGVMSRIHRTLLNDMLDLCEIKHEVTIEEEEITISYPA